MSSGQPGDLKPKHPGSRVGAANTITRLTLKTQALRKALNAHNPLDASDALRRKLGRTISNVDPGLHPPSGMLSKGKGLDVSDDTPQETTFQPRITNQPSGPSSSNWRRPEAPPHLDNRSSTLLLLQELKEQREEERRHRDQENERSRRRANLEEQSRIASTVASVVRRISDEDFRDPDFYSPKEDGAVDETHEKIARGIINASVHRDLIYDLLNFDSSSDVYVHLLMKFRSISRAAQLQAWQRFVSINPSKYNTTAGILAAFTDVAKSFDEMSLDLTFDDMMGLILQSNLKDIHQAAFDQKIELFMSTHDYAHPSFQDMLRLLDATRSEQKLNDDNRLSETASFRLDLASRTDSAAAEAPEDSKVNAMALSKNTKCYICKKPGHIAPDCPAKKRGVNQTNPPACLNQNPGPSPPCSVTYNFDQLPYIRPLQPESKAPNTASTKKVPDKHPSRAVEAKLINPDIFAEDEEENHFVFETEDLSAEPSGNRFNLRSLSINEEGQEVIWDSGASDNVTGNRYTLHDFVELAKPIAVRVATDSTCEYITGTGTLKFSGMNKTTVKVRKVYFCKNARSTLLSITAFKKANANFRINGNFDSIDLLSRNGRLLLRSNFDPANNTWPLNRPERVHRYGNLPPFQY
ncbi:uncharacterized protein PGTG_19594 [Puccinia graminis f. sp. tritici CRL 75-36-700-3]|uniref:CCHC-type domain-containing protein n=1 Tax=Puccinia graminis f. sp. tritici (strain CRL 75-36-700-3 / race SCCL) TaxID=418459 RepID=E3LAS0_PUCGT|nr:uncharacterized protein PGTG_19594 [Puccinia graminis f. sp. tritici CRL 75-36-700-3]EFP93645.2 hypothetical protein PGTG_19594 [Puccinia graminis f. sp. tritici CRL 75-36-700-3]